MIQIDKSHKKQAMDILLSSFVDYDLNYLMCKKHKKGYEKRFKIMMEYNFEECLINGEIWLTDDLKTGILMTKDPKKARLNFRFLFMLLKLVLSIGVIQTLKNIRIANRFLRNHPKNKDYLHLWIIAVIPEQQGKGYSSKILNFIDEYSNKDIYLETTSEKNVKVYLSKGYKIFDEANKKDYGINVWMLKKLK